MHVVRKASRHRYIAPLYVTILTEKLNDKDASKRNIAPQHETIDDYKCCTQRLSDQRPIYMMPNYRSL